MVSEIMLSTKDGVEQSRRIVNAEGISTRMVRSVEPAVWPCKLKYLKIDIKFGNELKHTCEVLNTFGGLSYTYKFIEMQSKQET